MKIIGKRSLGTLMEAAINILLVIGSLLYLSLPWSVRAYLGFKARMIPFTNDQLYYNLLIVLYISGLLAILAVWNGRKILWNINRGQPFIKDNAKRLGRVGIFSLLIAIVYFIAIFMIRSPFVGMISLTFLIVSGILFILSELFYQAAAYKEENDLTV